MLPNDTADAGMQVPVTECRGDVSPRTLATNLTNRHELIALQFVLIREIRGKTECSSEPCIDLPIRMLLLVLK